MCFILVLSPVKIGARGTISAQARTFDVPPPVMSSSLRFSTFVA